MLKRSIRVTIWGGLLALALTACDPMFVSVKAADPSQPIESLDDIVFVYDGWIEFIYENVLWTVSPSDTAGYCKVTQGDPHLFHTTTNAYGWPVIDSSGILRSFSMDSACWPHFDGSYPVGPFDQIVDLEPVTGSTDCRATGIGGDIWFVPPGTAAGGETWLNGEFVSHSCVFVRAEEPVNGTGQVEDYGTGPFCQFTRTYSDYLNGSDPEPGVTHLIGSVTPHGYLVEPDCSLSVPDAPADGGTDNADDQTAGQ